MEADRTQELQRTVLDWIGSARSQGFLWSSVALTCTKGIKRSKFLEEQDLRSIVAVAVERDEVRMPEPSYESLKRL
jgi:hypothetical protein